MNSWRKAKILLLACFVATFLVATSASADVLTFLYVVEFSGAQSPAGDPPWMSATFDDGNTAGSVTLTLDTFGLTGSEFVSGWYFNVDPAINPASLNITHSSGLVASSVGQATDAFQADGDGRFDLLFSYPTASGDPNHFSANQTSVYTISGTGITASTFDYLSAPAGGHGPFPTAAHVQGINGGSGWVTVPEPGFYGVLSLALGGLLFFVGRRRRSEVSN